MLDPYDKPFWEKSNIRREKRERKTPLIVDTLFRSNAQGQHMHSAFVCNKHQTYWLLKLLLRLSLHITNRIQQVYILSTQCPF